MQPSPETSQTLIGTIKSLLKQAAQARGSGESAEAERLYKQAAADAKAKDDVARAEALLGVAQARRDQGDRTGASINYAEAITLLRAGNDNALLAFALRHAADIRSELREYGAANAHIDEAIRLYRAADPVSSLDLANALRVAAMNGEREAHAAWREAETLYSSESVSAGVEECVKHLARLSHKVSDPASST
jgi:tetratricopeptide (TPR) repeat protein